MNKTGPSAVSIVHDVPHQRALVDFIKSQRWVYATLSSYPGDFVPAVQYPTQEQFESLTS